MARPQKVGLEYFPLDVDIDSDDKVAIIEAQHGMIGFAIVIKLFMKIYADGYFYKWREREQLLFSSRINVDINKVKEVVGDCVKWGLFDEKLYETHNVLTSKGIQRRYLEATKRRQRVEMDPNYLLLDKSEISVYGNLVINGVNVDINSNDEVINDDINLHSEEDNDDINPQSKVKESKVKESKEESTKEPSTPHQKIKDLFNSICKSYPKVIAIGSARERNLRARWKQFDFDIDVFENVFRKLEESDFCKGKNDRNWKADFDWLIKNDNNMVKVLEGKYDNEGGGGGGGNQGYFKGGESLKNSNLFRKKLN